MKICLVCSHGGHLTETLQILEAFQGHDIFFATYHSSRETEVEQLARAYFIKNIGLNPWRMLKAFWWAFKVLKIEHPQLVLSLGAEIALPFLYWARVLKIKSIYYNEIKANLFSNSQGSYLTKIRFYLRSREKLRHQLFFSVGQAYFSTGIRFHKIHQRQKSLDADLDV